MKVYNTLRRRKEEFVPLHGNRVYMFVCGVTPYDYSHLGHAKTYVAFDAIAKYLRYKGYSVFYLQNVTDVDDHIIQRAKELGVSESEVAEQYFRYFMEDMKSLGVDSVNLFGKATDFMPEIIEQIKGLIDGGFAYESAGNVYFEVKKFEDFGKLSRVSLEHLRAGARVEIDENKKNPEDFALWKAKKPGEPSWESPWGKGRPGWHIEDTAIAMAHFGDQYDIHGGATELIFPHHDSEIAQAEALTGIQPYVKYWLHTGVLKVGGEKMAKSLGNFWTIRDALKEYEAEVLRFFLLNAHYRSPIDFTNESLEEARSSYQRLKESLEAARGASHKAPEVGGEENFLHIAEKARMEFEKAMDDDFNTREAIAVLFELARNMNKAVDSGAGRGVLEDMIRTFESLSSILGILPKKSSEAATSDLIDILLELRERARKRKDYETSDWIRERLRDLGIRIEDTKRGTLRKGA